MEIVGRSLTHHPGWYHKRLQVQRPDPAMVAYPPGTRQSCSIGLVIAPVLLVIPSQISPETPQIAPNHSKRCKKGLETAQDRQEASLFRVGTTPSYDPAQVRYRTPVRQPRSGSRAHGLGTPPAGSPPRFAPFPPEVPPRFHRHVSGFPPGFPPRFPGPESGSDLGFCLSEGMEMASRDPYHPHQPPRIPPFPGEVPPQRGLVTPQRQP